MKLTGSHHDAEDLISHCIEICLLEKEKIKGVQERGKLRQYFIVMVRYQYYKRLKVNEKTISMDEQVTSCSHSDDVCNLDLKFSSHGFKNLANNLIDEEDQGPIIAQQKEDRVQATLDSMHFYTGGLLELYKTNTYRTIAAKTGIPYVSVNAGMKAAKKEFRKIYNGMKIAIIYPGLGPLQYHRLAVPLIKLAGKYNAELIGVQTTTEGNKNDKWVENLPEGITHVVFCRQISSMMQPKKVIMKLKLKGIKIICDIDEYWSLPKTHEKYERYKKIGLTKCITSNIQMADVIWTPTERLADEIKNINPNVYVAKNCLDLDDEQFMPQLTTDPHFDKFLLYEDHDVQLVKDAVQDVDLTIQSTYDDNKLLESFPNADFMAPSDLNQYATHLNNHRVVLLPLVGNKYNSLQSEIKLIEAGHFGRAVIASNVEPYQSHLKHMKNGILSGLKGWGKWIKTIKGDDIMQSEFGLALKEYVDSNYKIEKENKLRFDTL